MSDKPFLAYGPGFSGDYDTVVEAEAAVAANRAGAVYVRLKLNPFAAGRSRELRRVDITCGALSPDPEIDSRGRELSPLRLTTYGGCGYQLKWWYAYRCVDCGRWFHESCIRRHFSSSIEAPY